MVSAKPLLLDAPAEALPKTLEEVTQGSLLCGVVSHLTNFGLFVRFLGGVSGACRVAPVWQRLCCVGACGC